MASNLDRYKGDLKKLTDLSTLMAADLEFQALERESTSDKQTQEAKKRIRGTFGRKYQDWYTEAHALLRQLAPERLPEFEALYKGDHRRKNVDGTTYTIQDWLLGLRAAVNEYTGNKPFDDLAAILGRFQTQVNILKSVGARFESTLFTIKQLVQADVFDSELETARALHKNGFLRAAGVIAGVVLESHLAQVCTNHSITLKKKEPTIVDYNDALKDNDVIDIPQWRFIQRLGDLRNLCGHKKNREPTRDDVLELIDGVEKITKTLY